MSLAVSVRLSERDKRNKYCPGFHVIFTNRRNDSCMWKVFNS